MFALLLIHSHFELHCCALYEIPTIKFEFGAMHEKIHPINSLCKSKSLIPLLTPLPHPNYSCNNITLDVFVPTGLVLMTKRAF